MYGNIKINSCPSVLPTSLEENIYPIGQEIDYISQYILAGIVRGLKFEQLSQSINKEMYYTTHKIQRK